MRIRPLKTQDIRFCEDIVTKNYSPKYGKLCRRELNDMFGAASIKPYYMVAEENKKIIGFAGYIQSWMDYNIYQIFWVNVAPMHQGQGIGQALVTKIIKKIKRQPKAYLILLTASLRRNIPKYYQKNFKFKKLQSFGRGDYSLMSLSLEE